MHRNALLRTLMGMASAAPSAKVQTKTVRTSCMINYRSNSLAGLIPGAENSREKGAGGRNRPKRLWISWVYSLAWWLSILRKNPKKWQHPEKGERGCKVAPSLGIVYLQEFRIPKILDLPVACCSQQRYNFRGAKFFLCHWPGRV